MIIFQIYPNTKFRDISAPELSDYYFSHFWLATVQEVLQADWQDAWHSPQPPLAADCFKLALFNVLMCFMISPPKTKLLFKHKLDL